jgi:ribosomal protein S4
MLALPCNHTIGIGIEQSRWARQKHLHDVKVARGEARPQDAPRPQTLHEASLDNSFYMGKYSTKVDDCDTHGEIITLATASDRVRHAAHLVI